MYKVFFKRKPLILTTSNKIIRDSEILIDSKSYNYNILISALKSKKNKSVLYFNSDPSLLHLQLLLLYTQNIHLPCKKKERLLPPPSQHLE